MLASASRRSARTWTSSTTTGSSVRGEVGELVCKRAWPGMTRGIWGDPERYLETYWRRFPGVWTHGDWASVDEDGYWFLHGRSDDTLNIAGKRIGPAELESAAVGHPAVAEAAAIGVPHEVKGEVAWLYCVLAPGAEATTDEVADAVAHELGKAFAPERVIFVSALPKTRSAKIVRRAVRARALGQDPGRPLDAREPRGAGGDRPCRLIASKASRSSPAADAGSARRSRASSPDAGMRVAVTGRTREQVEAVAAEIGGLALVGDVSQRRRRRALGRDDRARARADRAPRRERGNRPSGQPTWERPVEDWWRVFEVNVLGVHLSCRAVVPSMLERGARTHRDHRQRRRVPPRIERHGRTRRARRRSCRYGETLANELAGRSPSSSSARASCGRMTERFGDDAPVDAARARAAARPRARVGARRRARRPLPPRRARRHRRPDRASRRDRRRTT